jgi:hypothetical protein
VVISVPASEKGVFNLLGGIGTLILGAAGSGFLVRGGVSFGDLVHDDECVFGPALNRAYELESKIADKPRVIVDRVVVEDYEGAKRFVAQEDETLFLDPFTFEYLSLIASLEQTGIPTSPEVWEKVGIPQGGEGVFTETAHYEILKNCLEGLKVYLHMPLPDKEWGRFCWLYDRIAKRLGLPLTSSYPRVMP